MPRYSYKCNICGSVAEIFHPMSERKADCEECSSSDALERIPSLFSVSDTQTENKTSTAKQRVDSYISEAKEELATHRKESTKDYEPRGIK